MKTKFAISAVLVAAACAAPAAFYSDTFTVNQAIPDGNPTGWSDTRNVSFFDSGWQITDVNVTLNVSGGYNGDLYAYLTHSSGFAVLLNRVGKGTGSSFGYANSGFNIVLDDQAAADIHLYQTVGGYSITGGADWQPDGRYISPLSSNATFDSASRDKLLSQFNGLDANGNWTLFFADLSGGATSTLVSWGLEITAVPEPVTVALGVFAAVFGGVQFLRWRRAKARA